MPPMNGGTCRTRIPSSFGTRTAAFHSCPQDAHARPRFCLSATRFWRGLTRRRMRRRCCLFPQAASLKKANGTLLSKVRRSPATRIGKRVRTVPLVPGTAGIASGVRKSRRNRSRETIGRCSNRGNALASLGRRNSYGMTTRTLSPSWRSSTSSSTTATALLWETLKSEAELC